MVGKCAKPGGDAGFREWLSSAEKVYFIVLGIALFMHVPSLIQTHGIRPADVYVSGGLILGTSVAWIWYRLRRNSVTAMFGYSYVVLVSTLIGFLLTMWEMRQLSKLGWLFMEFLWLYVAVFLVISVALPVIFVKRWQYLHDMFEDFRTHLPSGVISAARLWWWMSFKGSANRWSGARIALWIGIITTISMAIGVLGGRDAFGYFLFLSFLLITPATIAVVIARVWLQWKYLGWEDLEIQWT
jgi:hypothetical protein